jgi:hypothetical protein
LGFTRCLRGFTGGVLDRLALVFGVLSMQLCLC